MSLAIKLKLLCLRLKRWDPAAYREVARTAPPDEVLGLAMRQDAWLFMPEAVERLGTQEQLTEVATSAPAFAARIEATKRVTRQDTLAELARQNPDNMVGYQAMLRLDPASQAPALFEYARKAREADQAIERIEDQDALAELAVAATTPKARAAALRKLSESRQDVFAERAAAKEDLRVRCMAVAKLDPPAWQELLASIAREHRHDELGPHALAGLDPVRWEALLVELAEDSSYACRHILVRLLDRERQAELVARLEAGLARERIAGARQAGCKIGQHDWTPAYLWWSTVRGSPVRWGQSREMVCLVCGSKKPA